MEQQPAAPAAWYQDPEQPGRQRYWDGEAWTEHRRTRIEEPANQPTPPTPPEPLPAPTTSPAVRQPSAPVTPASAAEGPSLEAGVPASAGPATDGPAWERGNARRRVDASSGYLPTTTIKPGVVHSIVLAVVSLMLTFAFPLFLVSLVLSIVSVVQAYIANQAMNRGELPRAESSAKTAGRLRMATYISLPVIGIIAIVVLLVGAAMLLGL